MSSWAESNFHRVKNEVKARAHRRSGISFKISVAFCVDVTFTTKATQTCLEIPSSLTLLGFCSDRRRARLTPSQKLRLRKTQAFFFAQDDRLIDWFVVCVYFFGISRRHPLPQNFIIFRRGDSRIARFFCAIIVYLRRHQGTAPLKKFSTNIKTAPQTYACGAVFISIVSITSIP